MPNAISVTTPLPAADLFFESMVATAGLSQLEEMQVALLSEKPGLKPMDLLGKPMTVHVELKDGSKRHFNGLVSQFGLGASRGRYFGYSATVRPWLWFLTRTSDCRIFQDQSVPDIVKKVFADHGVANFEFKLFRQYRQWVYCVQYRESDFNFVARLLEHEGIYWYFEHSDGAHKLMLVDSHSAHDAAKGYDTLRYIENAAGVAPDQDYISDWVFSESVETGKSVLTSYDFEKPSTSLEVEIGHSRKYELSNYEGFDFQGDYIVKADGSQSVENRMDEIQTAFHQSRGSSNALGLAVGHTLKMSRHPRDDQNSEYLIRSLHVTAHLNVFESRDNPSAFDCGFSAIPSAQQFRPPRSTPKPFVQGPQTALVVGPGGDEIFTDKYGRVKVQFHWDRLGQKNDKSSCWVRVSSPWAGKNFGFMQIPRIGQEVVVDFLEGDPDQPLITGRVYNAEQMPPWELPANATQSGMLSRSSKGGSAANANALRFEDKKGSEQVWLHAEKNQDIEVENDETHWVGHDRKKTIDHDEIVHVKHDRAETVDNDESIVIHRDRSMKIDRDKSETVLRDKGVKVLGNHSEMITGSMSISVVQTLTESVGINYAETVGGAMELTVGAALAITVGAVMAETVAGAKNESVGGSKSETIGGSKSITLGKDRTEMIGGNQSLTVKKNVQHSIEGEQAISVTKSAELKAKKVQITADDEISFKTGSAEILMKKNGDITIKGNKISIKGDGDVIIKGSKIAEN